MLCRVGRFFIHFSEAFYGTIHKIGRTSIYSHVCNMSRFVSRKIVARVLKDGLLAVVCYVIITLIRSKLAGSGGTTLDTSWNFTDKLYTPPSPIPKDEMFNSTFLRDDVTLVTAFFDLGPIQKGDNSGSITTHDGSHYERWMKKLAQLDTRIIMFIEDYTYGSYFAKLRENSKISPKKTTMATVRRNALWAFGIASRIKEIFSTKGYPQFHPNTVNEHYCAMRHLKYELIDRILDWRLKTKYVGWIDIGYFGEKQTHLKSFSQFPTDIREDHVIFQQIGKVNASLEARDVIYQNEAWLSSSLFIARPEYMKLFIEDYKRTVNSLIKDHHLISSDEQVLYIMYLKQAAMKPRIPIQTYYHSCKCDKHYLSKLLMGQVK